MNLDLPETPEQLTAEWLSQALGWPISSVQQEVLGRGQGFLGDIVRLALTSDASEAPDSVIAKLPKTRSYRTAPKGRKIASAILLAQNTTLQQLAKVAA